MNPDAYLEMAETETRHWWFAGRRVLLASLITKLRLPPDARILEIGSGTGGNLEMLSKFGHVSAVEKDATARALAAAKTDGRFDIRAGSCPTEIPFTGQTFDLICLLDVLEHIEEDVNTLVAVRDLLAKGGRALLTVPAHRWLWSKHDEYLHHKRRYSLSELQGKISAAGLCTEKVSFFNSLLFPLAVAARFKDRLFFSRTSSGTGIPSSPLNALLLLVFSMERFLLDRLSLPFGISLLAIVRTQSTPDDRR